MNSQRPLNKNTPPPSARCSGSGDIVCRGAHVRCAGISISRLPGGGSRRDSHPAVPSVPISRPRGRPLALRPRAARAIGTALAHAHMRVRPEGGGARAAFCCVLTDAASLVLLLGEGVEERAQDGDAGADGAEGRDGCLEDDDRREDDDDTLDGVGDGMRDGRDLSQGEERDLIVNVVEEARDREQADHLRVGVAARERSAPRGGGGLGRLDEEGDGRDGDEAQDREDGEHVGRREVLAERLAVEHFLREDGLGGGRDGGRGASDEGHPRKGELFDRGEADATDDGHQRCVDRQREEVAEEDGRDERGPDGLGRLEHVRERDRAEAKRDDTTDVRACEQHA
mmetsp:Transcript_52578/g.138283  ORF Transcript_52578/g.138283 Transcript_52578/m.138283 type:complete len:341 (-) Transcript_52578:463-1485(-)